MAGTIMRSTDFKSVVEPILNEVFDGSYALRMDEAAKFTEKVAGIPRNYHEQVYMYGLPQAGELPDGTPVQYAAGGVLYTARWYYRVYGQAFALTKVLVEDGDHVRLGKTYSEALATSMQETDQTLAANILNFSTNNAFPGGDGQPLLSTAHPLAPSVGGTYSNLLGTPAALSQTSLEQILIQIRGIVDSTGKRSRVLPKQLITSTSNMFQADVILNSVLRSGDANNDLNPLKGILPGGALTVTRLTSSTAWYIQTDAPYGLTKYNRRDTEKSMEGDFETDSMRYKATARYVYGWLEPRNLFGTPGR